MTQEKLNNQEEKAERKTRRTNRTTRRTTKAETKLNESAKTVAKSEVKEKNKDVEKSSRNTRKTSSKRFPKMNGIIKSKKLMSCCRILDKAKYSVSTTIALKVKWVKNCNMR